MACHFCAIAAGDADAHRLYETDDVVAFLDANPAVRGHTLVVPTIHERDVLDDPSEAADVFAAVQTVGRALRVALDADGVSVFYTTPELVGDVTHPHVHLLPRDADDDVHLALERGTLDDAAATRLAERLRERVDERR
ncbi:Bis(5'-nucleosyl)-tetraphosphatase [Halarchaeum acidiphilum MH1-52-1]|uniref:Bis(5'-nucleosyl)-tetraphosphatase n=1 Tax=Halarchaeum acidiphilum MH1-52-1 TaxID=1261545 RepID=U3ACN6_9EURY|nr:HIT family protein [Halarchaeum acidiphilum]GAD52538.1 Bis(5'-nucleosyl)-tetraphosphatase [Halarchaeum acidiphilum MH1-52-1]